MTSPWNYTGPISSPGGARGSVTLVEGQTFCLSDEAGDVQIGLPHGLFLLDTRVLSRWELRLNGHPLEPLTVDTAAPFSATFVGRGRPSEGRADAQAVVFRHRDVGQGMRERVTINNFGLDPLPFALELLVDVDFADLFAVKEGRVRHGIRHRHDVARDSLTFGHREGRIRKDVDVKLSSPAIVEPGVATWHHTVAPQSSWEVCLEVVMSVDEQEIAPRFRCGQPDSQSVPTQRLTSWRQAIPHFTADYPPLHQAVLRSGEDLGALRIFDPDFPDRPIIAAGAPWFMTVFGRDSLLTAWMSLIVDPSLAQGVLETLARFQGTDVNPETEEEPGKILHEMRFGAATGLALGGGDIYYGTVDATPLFVMLLGELRRWGCAEDLVDRMLPHADRAMAWIEDFGDRDGDGYVEYQRSTADGLANQGWKDSWDGIRFADGSLPQTPIALAEVQGYVYAAYVARAHFADEAGDAETFDRYRRKAAALKVAFNRDFWLEDQGWFALGLDADKRPIDALASNMGHCLWTGIVDEDKAHAVGDRLLSPEMFSGWGIRTLATSMPAYNPVSYHNGSVWPHDNALCISGLMRYGMVDHAHRVIEALLDVAALNGGRLPELFAGFDRAEVAMPAAYPTSCVPQAWAAAAPLLMVRALLRLDPWVSRGRVWLAPALPPWLRSLHVEGVPLGSSDATIEIDGGDVHIDGLDGLELVTEPRRPLTATAPPEAPADG